MRGRGTFKLQTALANAETNADQPWLFMRVRHSEQAGDTSEEPTTERMRGTGAPGSTVTVRAGGAIKEVEVGADGHWSLQLRGKTGKKWARYGLERVTAAAAAAAVSWPWFPA